jgi:DNA-binding transcriptional LysR family regulator
MLIDKINLNHLRILEAVYRLGSTIAAAEELHLTQSGVSQHLQSLEGQLGRQLFDRINRRLVPTPFAHTLYEQCHRGLLHFEQALGELLGEQSELRGTLSVGVPTEFGHNLVLDALAKFAILHPAVKIHISYGLASDMNDRLLSGQLDFAFVDDLAMSPQIVKIGVYEEVLSLFSSLHYIERHPQQLRDAKEYFESLDYIDYLPQAPILRLWLKHHWGLKNINLNLRAVVREVQGISKLIFANLGVGVLPEHHAVRADPKGQFLYRFKGRGRPLKNTISVASLTDRTHSPLAMQAVQAVSAYLKERSI